MVEAEEVAITREEGGVGIVVRARLIFLRGAPEPVSTAVDVVKASVVVNRGSCMVGADIGMVCEKPWMVSRLRLVVEETETLACVVAGTTLCVLPEVSGNIFVV